MTSSTTARDDVFARAFPGTQVPETIPWPRDRECLKCEVQWRREKLGAKCWVCGKTGTEFEGTGLFRKMRH